eukprot:TRINITY_DN7201_c0_g1_i1.p2 TRINITY_DN7201_c0_g1~~TRINITY_DN7201_c0_g1_i1.p2  ORF type:complete len:331 (-),score=104.16 TRINITY_DN7201_c0_g1_i1:233-1225(-)
MLKQASFFAFAATATYFSLFLFRLAVIEPRLASEAEIRAAGGIPVRLGDGRMVEVFEAGDPSGDVVLWFPSGLSTAQYVATPFYDQLFKENKFRVIALSPPGQGLSDRNGHLGAMRVGVYHEDVAHVLRQLAIDGDFYVFGYSIGSALAGEVASHFAPRVKAALLAFGLGPGDETIDGIQDNFTVWLIRTWNRIPVLRYLLGYLLYSPSRAVLDSVPDARNFLANGPQPQRDIYWNDVLRSFAHSQHHGYADTTDVANGPYGYDWRRGLANVARVTIGSVPTDHVNPPAHQRYLHRHINNSRLVEFDDPDGFGHLWGFAFPDKLVAALRA